jgi:hypothetical protein
LGLPFCVTMGVAVRGTQNLPGEVVNRSKVY